jgi:hypothetical protein
MRSKTSLTVSVTTERWPHDRLRFSGELRKSSRSRDRTATSQYNNGALSAVLYTVNLSSRIL